MAVWSSVEVRTLLLVSTSGASPTTVTSSFTPLTPRLTFKVTWDPTVTLALRLTDCRPFISKVAS